MGNFFDHFFAAIWNRAQRRGRGERPDGKSLNLGSLVIDGQVTKRQLGLTTARRTTHIAVLGKTGSGKSSLLRHLCAQDIEAGRGFVYFDLHGDDTPFLLATMNAVERRRCRHVSDKLLLIDPADQQISLGFNPLEASNTPDFGQIADVERTITRHAHLDHLGARTSECLRNTLFALSANGLTLVEIGPFLTHSGFRARCLKQVSNAEVRQYFELRYDELSEGMRTAVREPILNKTSALTADRKFRHILGQQHSTFSIREAMDEGYWIILDLNKGRLGEQAITLGSLFFTILKSALFTRTKRTLFTLYCDEMQNLVAYDSGLETVLSEARKFGVSVVSANQFLDQYSPEMRSALLAVGTHAFFQLSPNDAAQVSQMLDGGRALAERLKNLRQRHAIVKTGSERWTEMRVPTVEYPKVDYTDLLNRTRYQHGSVRAHIERDIASRQAELLRQPKEVLHDWE